MPQEIYNPTENLDLYIERHRVRVGQVVLYQFDMDFLDSSPNAIALTENGTVPFTPYVRALGKKVESAAGEFTDTNNLTSADTIFRIAGDLTIMCMLYVPSGSTGDQTICFSGGPEPDIEDNNIWFRLTLTSGLDIQFLSESGAGVDETVTATTSLNNNQWHHVAATRNGGTGDIELYLDGVSVGSGNNTLHTGGSVGDFTIGRNKNIGGKELECYLGSFSLIEDELTSGEISTTATRLLGDWT